MKTLNRFITEKLKITKNTKTIGEYAVINYVMKYFIYDKTIPDDIINKIKEGVTEWAFSLKRQHLEYLLKPYVNNEHQLKSIHNDYIDDYKVDAHKFYTINNGLDFKEFIKFTYYNMGFIVMGSKDGINLYVSIKTKGIYNQDMIISIEYDF